MKYEPIQRAIFEILALLNFSYAENVRIISDRYRDQIATPLEIGMHWVKHVAKNKGAPHLRSVAVELTFCQLYNLDVWAVILSALLFGVYLLLATIKIITSKFNRIKEKTL